jgi:hypothetical protein
MSAGEQKRMSNRRAVTGVLDVFGWVLQCSSPGLRMALSELVDVRHLLSVLSFSFS